MFPKDNSKFSQYYAPAIPTKSLWRFVIGITLMAVIYVASFTVFGAIIAGFMGAEGSADALILMSKGSDPQNVVLLLSTFIGMFLAILIVVRVVHKRGLKSLLGSNFHELSRNFGIAVLFIACLTTAGALVFSFMELPKQNLPFGTWIKWMLIATPLILIQVSSEELLFRGYMQQQLAARFKSRVIWLVLPAVLFGMAHYDAVTMGSNAWLVVAHTTLFGLIAADITVRTGNLGAAIGLHFANNIFALSIVSLKGSLDGLGLFVTPFDVSDEAAVRYVLSLDLAVIIALYTAFIYRFRNKPEM